MNVLIVDTEGMGLDFAQRCAEAGHKVRLFHDKPCRDGDGFEGVQKITDWKASMAWAKDGLILPTGNTKYLTDFDRYRDLGFKIFGPTKRSAALEIDRQLGMQVLKSAGVEIPAYEMFASLEDACKHVRKSDQAFVFKTLGSEEDKALSYVASDPADLVGWIERQLARGLNLKGACMLQQKIDMLAEVGASGWFGPEGFLPGKWQVCFEHKKLMDGEVGPNTGEMGTVCQYVEEDKLAEDMLKPLEPVLAALGHRGDFAINCGVDTNGKAWPFEFTARCGWPAFFIQTASHKGDPAQWMRDLLDGKDSLKVDRRVAIGVVCAQPRWPYGDSKPECVEGNPIAGLDEVWGQVHPAQMMIGKGPMMDGGKVRTGPVYQTTGELPYVVTGLGSTVTKARESAYEAVKATGFPDRMYRTDIGLKLEEPLGTLHEHGWAVDMEF